MHNIVMRNDLEVKMKKYTVFVGGTEVNDYMFSSADKKHTEKVAQAWRDDGYDDVAITECEIPDVAPRVGGQDD